MSDIIASAEITVTDVKDGVGIDGVVTRFLVTHLDKGVTISTGDWSVEPPSMDVVNKYLWSYETITYTDGHKQDGKPAIIGVYGEEGLDGSTPYFHIAYANSADGTVGFSVDDSSGKEYIGQYTSYARTGKGRNLVVRTDELKEMWIARGGEIVPGSGTAIMKKIIDVYPNQILTFTKTDSSIDLHGGFWRWQWLDENKDFINRAANDSNEFQWVVPSNAHYIQVSYPMDSYPQVEKGTEATEYSIAPEDAIKDSNNPADYSWTKIKGDKGDTGDDGKDAISAVLTNESITFAADKEGKVHNDNYVGNTGTFLLMEGTVNKSAETKFEKVNQTNVSATINTNGSYTISSMINGKSVTTGQVTFRATYKGTTIDKTVTISKSIAGQTGGKGDPGAPGGKGDPGAPGAPATSYWLTSSVDTITVKYNGDYDPKTITYYGHSKTGSNNTQNYAGRFIIQTSIDGVNFTEAYRSQSNMNKVDFSVPEDVLFIKAKFYQAGGTTYLLDEQTTPILYSADGLKGVGLEDKDYQVGTEIFTDKADDSVVHVEIDGKSYQHAGSGKNLIGYKELKNYPRDERWSGNNRVDLKLKPNTNYTLSTDIPQTASPVVWFNGGSTNNAVYKDNPKTYRTDSTGENLWFMTFYSRTYGSELYNGTYYIQLEEGAEATEYEEYRPPAPTPDYPIEIHSLNDFDVVSSVGRRNLYPDLSAEWQESTFSGWQRYFHSIPIGENEKVKPGDTIAWSGVLHPESQEAGIMAHFVLDGGGHSQAQSNFLPAGEIGSVSGYRRVPNNAIRMQLALRHSSGSAPQQKVRYKELKIEQGSIPTAYSPAPEDITESDIHLLIDKINLSLSEPLRSVGDVKDRLFRDSDGLWKVVRNVGEHTLNGTEDWTLEQKFNRDEFIQIYTGASGWNKKIAGDSEGVSNRFVNIGEAAINTGNGLTGFRAHTDYDITRFRISPQKLLGISYSSTNTVIVNSWSDWLSNNNVTITYLLQSPTIETLEQELQYKLNNLHSFQDSNYVYTVINDKTDIISENLKPILRSTFKGGGYYTRWKPTHDLEKATEYIEQEIKRTQNTAWIRAGMRVGYSSFTQANPNSVYICGLEYRDGYRDMVLVDKPAEIYIRESNETAFIPNQALSVSGIPDETTAYIIWDNTNKSLFLAYLENKMTQTGVDKKRWRNNTSEETIIFNDSLFAIGEIEVQKNLD